MEGRIRNKGHWSPLAAGLAILFTVVLIAGLVLRFWAADREYGFAGPTHITTGSAGVFVYASGDILHLSSAGELFNVFGRERTLLADDPLDLVLLESGELLVAEQQPAKIRLCNTETWACRSLGEAAISGIERQFKVLPADGVGTWLLTDARGDALWQLDESMSVMTAGLPENTLAGPNGLAFDREGRLWLADTDHRRIVELLPRDDGGYVIGREHSAMNELTVGNRHYPMMVEPGEDGRLWVAQAAEFTEAYSDLVAYDPDGGAVAVADLPGGAYATDLAALGKDMLVTDMERFAAYRVDTSSLAVSAFGDQAFQDRMQAYREQRAMYGRLGMASLAAIIVAAFFLIIVAIRVTPKDRRWSQIPPAIDIEGAAAAVPQTAGVHWLERSARNRWMMNWFEKGYYVLFGLLCLVSALIYLWSCEQPWPVEEGGLSGADRLGLLLLLTCLVVASFIPMIHIAAGVFRRRLGSDGQRVHMELENGRRLSVKPGQLCWNNRAVFYREFTFPMQTGRKNWIYAEGEVQTWLAPLLREARRLNEWQILKHQWRNRDRMLLAVTGAIMFMGAILLLVKLISVA